MALPVMARALSAQGVEIEIATTDDDGPGRRYDAKSNPLPALDGLRVHFFPKQTEFYKVSLPLRNWLRANAGAFDVLHIHGVFSHACLAAAGAARRRRRPYIVRPLGVLNRWGMENRRRWLKDASFRLLDRPMLDHAAAIHYTSDEELREAARLRLRPRPVVIPLGLEADAFAPLPSPEAFHAKFPLTRGKRVLLFMSRLHAKKGVEPLLEAFGRIKPTFENMHLVLAGDGDAAYVGSLRKKAQELDLDSQITWAGFLDGEMKRAAFAAAELFVLPSYSENFGIALLEALAAGLPCVTTPEVALARDMLKHDADCLRLTDNTAPQLAETLVSLLNEPLRAKQMGVSAQNIARDHFSTRGMASALVNLYSECLSR